MHLLSKGYPACETEEVRLLEQTARKKPCRLMFLAAAATVLEAAAAAAHYPAWNPCKCLSVFFHFQKQTHGLHVV